MHRMKDHDDQAVWSLTVVPALQSADDARKALSSASNVSVVEIPVDDGWARDWGPSVSPAALQAICPHTLLP